MHTAEFCTKCEQFSEKTQKKEEGTANCCLKGKELVPSADIYHCPRCARAENGLM